MPLTALLFILFTGCATFLYRAGALAPDWTVALTDVTTFTYAGGASEFVVWSDTRRLHMNDKINYYLGHISRSLDCFTSNFSKTVCDTAKVTIDY